MTRLDFKSKLQLIVFAITILTFIWVIFSSIHTYNTHLDKIENQIDEVKQLILYNVIWGNEIPLQEKSKACDIYIKLGYNSLTKKHCDSIIVKVGNKNEI